jgi:hypothetical protein
MELEAGRNCQGAKCPRDRSSTDGWGKIDNWRRASQMVAWIPHTRTPRESPNNRHGTHSQSTVPRTSHQVPTSPHGDSLAVRQRHRRANLSGTRFSTALWPLDIRLRKEDIDSHPLQAARWAVRSTREDASQFPQPYGKDAASQTSKFGAHRHLVVHKIRRFEVKLLQRCWKRSKKPEFRVVTSLGADQILSPSVSMVIRKKGASSVSCVRDSTRVLAPSSVKCIQQVP